MASLKQGISLPKSERRRKYFQQLAEEAALLFRTSPADAEVFAERFVVMLRSKLSVGDEVHFGSGRIFPKVSPPRSFTIINGKGTGEREKTQFGERKHWRIKFNSRWTAPE